MKKKLSEKAAETLGVPKDVLMNIPRITISGDREIYIEHHKGLAGFGDGFIKVASGMGNVVIYGMDLAVSVIRTEDILVEGSFTRVEFEREVKKRGKNV